VLASLEPAISVALAALGVLVGLEIEVRRRRDVRLLTAAVVEASMTIAVVGAGAAILLLRSPSGDSMPWLLALMLGVCAAPSSTATDRSADSRYGLASRLGDLDDVLPIVLAVLAVTWERPGAPLATAKFIVEAAMIAALIAVAMSLLVTQTTSESEQRVFVVGGLLLLGGASAYLSLSAIFAGFLAGLFWSATGGRARETVGRDVRYLQHPLAVLLLVVAGSRFALRYDVLGLVAAYVMLRVVGKMLGGWFARRALISELPPGVGLLLSSPGIVGIAIALNVLQVGGASDAVATLFTVVVLGSLGSELLSLFLSHQTDSA